MTASSSEKSRHPNPSKWWDNRRRGMYIGIFWAIFQTPCWAALGYYKPETMEVMGAVIGWSYSISGVLILGYYCNTAIEEAVKNRSFGG